MSPLHLACLYGHLKIVSILVDNGANLRCKDKDATTPLHLVCAEGTLDVSFYEKKRCLRCNWIKKFCTKRFTFYLQFKIT